MKILFLLTGLLLISCSKSNFKKVENLESFRILAIISSAPEVAAGGSSTISLLISDRKGGGRVISGTVKRCIDPGVSLGAMVNCEHDRATITSSYSIDTINDVDLGAANLYTGLATNTVAVTVPSTILVGRSAQEQFNGVAYLVIFSFRVDGQDVMAFKRVTATNRASLNTNPTLSSVKLNGSTITVKPTQGDQLSISASTPQSFDYQTVEGIFETRTEKAEVAWYITEGILSRPKASLFEAVEYKSTAPSGSEVVVAVLRDDRGGVAYSRNVLP